MFKISNFCFSKLIKNKLFHNKYRTLQIRRKLSSVKSSVEFENYLNAKIKMKGPITVAEFMKEALGNPKWVRL